MSNATITGYIKPLSFCQISASTLPAEHQQNNKTFWPRLFKERITLIQRISRYPADKFYPLASARLFEGWIALSSRYPADKVIQVKVGSITFYPPDKLRKNGRSSVAPSPEQYVEQSTS